ncbi:hypothetical protein GJ496_011138 [Pomphorhynchus laevis]|nr:hypothetical protein GJ496_011138 [Pomphorhynchus laevis]
MESAINDFASTSVKEEVTLDENTEDSYCCLNKDICDHNTQSPTEKIKHDLECLISSREDGILNVSSSEFSDISMPNTIAENQMNDILFISEKIKKFVISEQQQNDQVEKLILSNVVEQCDYSKPKSVSPHPPINDNDKEKQLAEILKKARNFIKLESWNEASALLDQLDPTFDVLVLMARIKFYTNQPMMSISYLKKAIDIGQNVDVAYPGTMDLLTVWRGVIAVSEKYPNTVDIKLVILALRSILLWNFKSDNTTTGKMITLPTNVATTTTVGTLSNPSLQNNKYDIKTGNDIFAYQRKCAIRYLHICFDQRQLTDFACFFSYLPDKFMPSDSIQIFESFSRFATHKQHNDEQQSSLPSFIVEEVFPRLVGDECIENTVKLLTNKFPEYFYAIDRYLRNLSTPNKAAFILNELTVTSCQIMLKYECLQLLSRKLPAEILEISERLSNFLNEQRHTINSSVLKSIIRFLLSVSKCQKLKMLIKPSILNLITLMKCNQHDQLSEFINGRGDCFDQMQVSPSLNSCGMDKSVLIAMENSSGCLEAVILAASYMISQRKFDWATKFMARAKHLIDLSDFSKSAYINSIWFEISTLYLVALQRFEELQLKSSGFDREVLAHLLLSSGNITLIESLFDEVSNEELQLIEPKCILWFARKYDISLLSKLFPKAENNGNHTTDIANGTSILTKRTLAWICVYYSTEDDTTFETSEKALNDYCSCEHDLPSDLLYELDLLKACHIYRYSKIRIETALKYLKDCLEKEEMSRLAVLLKCRCLCYLERLDEAYRLITTYSEQVNCKDYAMFVMYSAMVYWKLHPNYDSKCTLALWSTLRKFANTSSSTLGKLYHRSFECIVDMYLRKNSRNLAFNQLSSSSTLDKLILLTTLDNYGLSKAREPRYNGRNQRVNGSDCLINCCCIWCAVRYSQVVYDLSLARSILGAIAAYILHHESAVDNENNSDNHNSSPICYDRLCDSRLDRPVWIRFIINAYIDVQLRQIWTIYGVPVLYIDTLHTKNIRLLEQSWHQILFADEVKSVLSIDLKRLCICEQQHKELIKLFTDNSNNGHGSDNENISRSIVLHLLNATDKSISDSNSCCSDSSLQNINLCVGSKFRKLGYIANILARNCFNSEYINSDHDDNVKSFQWIIRALRVDPTSLQNWTLLSYMCAKFKCMVFSQRAAFCAIRAANCTHVLNQIPCEWRIAPVLTWINLAVIYIMIDKFDLADSVLTEAKLHVPLYTPLCPAWNAALVFLKLKEAVLSRTSSNNVDVVQILHITRYALRRHMYKFLGQMVLRPRSHLTGGHNQIQLNDRHDSTPSFIHVALQALACYLRCHRMSSNSEFSVNQSSTFFMLTDYLHAEYVYNQRMHSLYITDRVASFNSDAAKSSPSALENIEKRRILLACTFELQGNFRAALRIYSLKYSENRRDAITAAKIRCLVKIGHFKQALQMSKQGGPLVRKEIIICLKQLRKFKEALALAQQEKDLQQRDNIQSSDIDYVNWDNVCACLKASLYVSQLAANSTMIARNNTSIFSSYVTGAGDSSSITASTLSECLTEIRHPNVTSDLVKLSNGCNINLIAILNKHSSMKYSDCRALLHNLVFSACSNQDQLVDAHINLAEYDEGNVDRALSFELRLSSLNSSISIGRFFNQPQRTCLRQINLLWKFWHDYLNLHSNSGINEQLPHSILPIDEAERKTVFLDINEECEEIEHEQHQLEQQKEPNYGVIDTQICNIAESLFGQHYVYQRPVKFARLDIHIAHMFPHLFLQDLRQQYNNIT